MAGDPAVVAEFVADEEADEDGGGQPHRQAGDGDAGIEPVPAQGPEGGGDVAPQHGGLRSRPGRYSYRSAVTGRARATSQAWVETVAQAMTTAAAVAARNSHGGRSTR